MNSNSSAKVFPSNEFITKQISKIAADGNRPEDWKRYIDGIKLMIQSMDEPKRNLILMYWYGNAFKSIPATSKCLPYAHMLVDYAWVKSYQSLSDAENLLSYGRTSLRHFAIVHIASAELALKAGNREKAKRIIKSAYSHGAEPVSLIKEAAKRLCMGYNQLMIDEDSSSSSGHESSEQEMSGECSGSFFRTFGQKQEHSSSNFPSLKYDTEELQEGVNLFSKIRETGGNDTRTKDEELNYTSPVKISHHQEDSVVSSPLMPKTPKTPAFSSQHFQSIFNSKKHNENNTEDKVEHKDVPSVVTDSVIPSGIDSMKGPRENLGLLNLVTPCAKKKPDGTHNVPLSSQKRIQSSGMSKMKSFAGQLPRRVKVEHSSTVNEDDGDIENIGFCDKESSQKLNVKKSFQLEFSTRGSKSVISNTNNGTLTSESLNLSVPFANSKTFSVHKNTTRVAKNRDSDTAGAPVDRKLFADDSPIPHIDSDVKPLESNTATNKANDACKSSSDEQQVPLSHNTSKDQRNRQSESVGHQVMDDQKKARENINVIDVGSSSLQTNNPQPNAVPQIMNTPAHAMNPPTQPPVQNGQKLIYVNGKPYIVIRLVGRGGSGKVYQVQDPDTFEMKAVKSVNLSGASPQILDSYKNEIALLKKLQGCDCVIRLFDSEYDRSRKKLLVVMECGETDLANFVAKNGSIKNQDELYPVTVCYLWGHMVRAVRAMHKEGVVHSDLKPANFILVSGNMKLIDFGIADSIQQDKTSMLKEIKMGTPSYMSPEALMANENTDPSDQKPVYKIGFKSDVWSLGCILYQMVYGQTPFYNCRYKLEAIVNPAHVIKFPPTNDTDLTDILKKCLTRDVKLRPTTEQLMMHPYLTKQAAAPQPAVNNDPISKLMSEGASIASASPRSQQAFCLKFQKAMEVMNSAKKPSSQLLK